MEKMKLRDLLQDSMQRRYGNSRVVGFEEIVQDRCGARHVYSLSGEPRDAEPLDAIILRETAAAFREKVQSYLLGALKGYRVGSSSTYGEVTVRGDGWLCEDGTESLVEISIRGDSQVASGKSPAHRKSLLVASAKAHVLEAKRVVLICIDCNSQSWSFWRISGDFENASTIARDDACYVSATHNGSMAPIGMVRDAVCRACPYKGSCDAGADVDPVPMSLAGVSSTRDEDLENKVNSYLFSLNRKPNGRRRGVISPSEISTSPCDLKIALGLLKTKQVESVSPSLRRIFDYGHGVHDVVQHALLGVLPGFVPEDDAVWPKLRIAGSCDGSFTVGVLEIKSISEKGFKSLSGPKKDHVRQATIYAKILGHERIHYLYVCKATGSVREFVVDTMSGVWHEVAARAERIIRIVDAGELPEGEGSDYTCSRCKYGWKCKPDLQSYTDKQRQNRRF